jgi:hypothetical protein
MDMGEGYHMKDFSIGYLLQEIGTFEGMSVIMGSGELRDISTVK